VQRALSRAVPLLIGLLLAACGEAVLEGQLGDGGDTQSVDAGLDQDVGSTETVDAAPKTDASEARDAETPSDADAGFPDAGFPDAGFPDVGPPDLGSADSGPPPAGEPPGLVGITEAHNVVRASVGVAPLTWDPLLAAVAQAWADTCTDNSPPSGLLDHNSDRSSSYPGYVGENIYAASGQARPQYAVDAWAAEGANYDYASNSCAAGRICGHYTQMVWAASERLGCGISNCPNLTYSNSIVCNYSPGGNTGGRPY
jgi:hypothetical protein